MAEALHMVQLRLDPRRLLQMVGRARLPLQGVDTGYAVHCALGALFGELAPAPFALPHEQHHPTAGPNSPTITVLGYTQATGEQLREHARLQATPEAYEVCDWSSLAVKPMPTSWRAGQVLRFQVRLCPIVRTKHPGAHERRQKNGRPISREVDAFLVACWKAPPDAAGKPGVVDRQRVYIDWLAAQLAAGGAAMSGGEMIRGQREVLWRRDHPRDGGPRKGHRLERPDVTIEGSLTVTDPMAFATLLARGVGRHRAFGFGMLLVRPG